MPIEIKYPWSDLISDLIVPLQNVSSSFMREDDESRSSPQASNVTHATTALGKEGHTSDLVEVVLRV